MSKVFAGVALGICAAASSAVAQTPVRHVSGYAFEEEAWRFVAVHSTPGQRIDAFVAVAKANVTVGDNIVVVAYVRGASDSDPWTAKTWTTTDRIDAIKSAKVLLNIDDADDANWGLDAPIGSPNPTMIEPAKDYQNGIMTDDPAYWWIATDPDNDELIATFAEWGLKVADIKLEAETPGCTTSDKLAGMAKGIETALPMAITDEDSAKAAATAAAVAAASAFVCQPATPTPPPPTTCTPGPITPWVTTPWRPVGPMPAMWTLESGVWTAGTGTWLGTCTYKACRTYVQTQSCTWRRADCTTYTCTQVQTGTGCVTLTCNTSAPASPPSPSCPASPVPWCTTTTPAGAGWPAAPAVIIAPWGPPCN